MKLNVNKILYITINSIGIALGCIASSLILILNNSIYSYIMLFITYLMGINLVNIRNKYPLLLKKDELI